MGEQKNTGPWKMIPINPTVIVVIITTVVSGSSIFYVEMSNRENCKKQADQTNYVEGHWFWDYCGDIDFR